jgi:AraC-like DNA-binding protein
MQLHPHRVQQLLGVLPSELNNLAIDLTLIKPAFNQLWHQLAEAVSFDARVQVLQQELPVLAAAHCQRSEQLSHLFLATGTESFQSVEGLARQVCYSTRQLNRVVHQLFGVSAEELTGYKKFVESVKRIHTDNASLTSIAYHSGFYDQAHFCRVFKSYTDLTPNQYRKRKSHLPFHLFP